MNDLRNVRDGAGLQVAADFGPVFVLRLNHSQRTRMSGVQVEAFVRAMVEPARVETVEILDEMVFAWKTRPGVPR